ncbi:hypothetical protein C8J57DRAFT_1230295 [Mycena rebaudengoi]|nr:hypothetical protein C8J57DRAFT_1230295 [Mycena rebaudengoi]
MDIGPEILINCQNQYFDGPEWAKTEGTDKEHSVYVQPTTGARNLEGSSSVSLTTSRFRRRRRHQTAASELRHPRMISTSVRGMSGWVSAMELHERNDELCPPREASAATGAKQATAARDSSETFKSIGGVVSAERADVACGAGGWSLKRLNRFREWSGGDGGRDPLVPRVNIISEYAESTSIHRTDSHNCYTDPLAGQKRTLRWRAARIGAILPSHTKRRHAESIVIYGE